MSYFAISPIDSNRDLIHTIPAMTANTVTQADTKEREMTTTSITLDADLWREVKKLAIDRRTSAVALIEESLRSHLKIAQ